MNLRIVTLRVYAALERRDRSTAVQAMLDHIRTMGSNGHAREAARPQV